MLPSGCGRLFSDFDSIMTTTWVTRCPQCATAFRLNRQQLTAAGGNVRCGNCLKVFKAPEHLLPGSAPLPDALDSQQPAAPQPAAARPAATTGQPGPRTAQATATPGEEAEFSDAFSALNGDEEQDPFAREQPERTIKDGADESWAEAMLAELEQEQSAATAAPTRRPTASESRAIAPTQRETPNVAAPADNPQARATEQTAENASEPTTEATPEPHTDQQQWLQDLAAEPISLEQPPRRRYGRIIGWTLLNLAVALMLLGQYSYYHFDQLARSPSWRPTFARLCPLAGCTLPGIQDIARIRTGNLVVRSHERYPGALSVDAVIYNTAAHAQPFPDIELVFADLDNDPVASRIFTPREYLGGELAGAQLMPSNTPIYLALEIKDPGQGALNYQLSFHPARGR